MHFQNLANLITLIRKVCNWVLALALIICVANIVMCPCWTYSELFETWSLWLPKMCAFIANFIFELLLHFKIWYYTFGGSILFTFNFCRSLTKQAKIYLKWWKYMMQVVCDRILLESGGWVWKTKLIRALWLFMIGCRYGWDISRGIKSRLSPTFWSRQSKSHDHPYPDDPDALR